jgi:hypothetical protein
MGWIEEWGKWERQGRLLNSISEAEIIDTGIQTACQEWVGYKHVAREVSDIETGTRWPREAVAVYVREGEEGAD